MAIDMAKYMRERRAKRRQELLSLAGGRCIQCGSEDELQFDHREDVDRLFRLSGKGLDGPWGRILAEMDKCDLLCSQHHREKTVATGRIGGSEKLPTCKLHGTGQMYDIEGCRCNPCVQWKKDYRRKLVTFMGAPTTS